MLSARRGKSVIRDGFLEVVRDELLGSDSRGPGKGMSRVESPCLGSSCYQCGKVRHLDLWVGGGGQGSHCDSKK